MTTTSDKAHRIASMIYAVDRYLPGQVGKIIKNYGDVLEHKGTPVEVSKDREDYPRLVELERELSILLGHPELPTRKPAPWEIDEMDKLLPAIFRSMDQLGPCNIKNCDSRNPDRFEVQSVRREPGVNGVIVIARDHLGEDVKFTIKVERS